MPHLSKALEKYYARQGNKIIFRDKKTLNQLALAMWERLGCRHMDASVLSRVLKGERLFTGAQLKAFCALLPVSKKEEAYLFTCLQYDLNARVTVDPEVTQLSSSLTSEAIAELTAGAFDIFYQGKYDMLEKRYSLVRQLAGIYRLSGKENAKIDEMIGLNLYLKGRIIANRELPTHVIGRMSPIFKRLLALSYKTKSELLYGYAHVLQCTAYYVAGGYSGAVSKRRFYRTSIIFAREALEHLPKDDHEAIFAMRSMAASACYIQDQDVITYVLRKAKESIPRQPKENYINTLHLSTTLSKCLAASRMADPFLMQEYAANYFKRDLTNTGVYEVSSIKEEIDALLLLQTQDKQYIRSRLTEGIQLTYEYDFPRQRKYLNRVLQSL